MVLPIKELGRLIAVKRGARGVRAAAADVGISSATLSRVERGHLPDLETFAKICKWLDCDPCEFLGFPAAESAPPQAMVHFRKKKTVTQETALALGELIIATQKAIQARNSLVSS